MFAKLFAVSCLVGAAVAERQLDPINDHEELMAEIASLAHESTSVVVKLSHDAASKNFLTQACAMEQHSSNYFFLGSPYDAKKWTSSCGKKGELFSTPTNEFTDHAGGHVKVSNHFKE
jgi:hypothetical protein